MEPFTCTLVRATELDPKAKMVCAPDPKPEIDESVRRTKESSLVMPPFVSVQFVRITRLAVKTNTLARVVPSGPIPWGSAKVQSVHWRREPPNTPALMLPFVENVESCAATREFCSCAP